MVKMKAFEQHAIKYEEWFQKYKFVYQSELFAIKKLLPSEGKGIEIGAGSGQFCEPLGIRFGIDPSLTMRQLANKKRVIVIGGIAENLPFKDSSFDFALMVTTICFLDDIEKAFHETFRILKHNGYIIIGFIDKNSKIGLSYQRNKGKSLFYREANFFSVDEVISYLKKTKFTDFHFNQTIFKSLDDIKNVEPLKKGYGQGSFVVIKAIKELEGY
jgi:SAM-dependent methyltransferase